MDNSAPSHSILDTLRTVEFRLGLKGYNVDEVDEYLEKAAVEAEQVQERLRTADERLREATERISQLETELASAARSPGPRELAPAAPVAGDQLPSAAVTDETLQRTLVLAQKFVEHAKRESEAEAAQVVSRAEERARTLLSQAEERARHITTQAEERLRDEVARLEGARARLASDVEAMERHLDEQRTKIRASLVEALRWVDERLEEAAAREDGDHGAEDRSGAPSPGRGTSASPPSAPSPPSAARTEPAAAASLGPVETASARSQASPPGVPEHQPTASTQAVPAAERAEAAVGARASILAGDLFAAGREQSGRSEERRLGE